MQKIKFIVDSPSDIPDEELARYGIEMLSVPINVDGEEYMERQSFSTQAFYSILENARELPVTSRIPVGDFVQHYHDAWAAGYTDIIAVTINSGGSGIYESACMAADLFYQERPEAKKAIAIHLIDSRSYSVGYGHPVIQAAKMAEGGQPVKDIIAYLEDYFDRLEIYLACYTLEYAKRSGRITAAAAFVGDVLGLRPIISMIDGKTKTVEKVRGDKQVVHKLVDLYRKRHDPNRSEVIAVSGSADEYGQELCRLLQAETGKPVAHYKAGASIVINAGPRMAAICVLGEKRGKTKGQ